MELEAKLKKTLEDSARYKHKHMELFNKVVWLGVKIEKAVMLIEKDKYWGSTQLCQEILKTLKE